MKKKIIMCLVSIGILIGILFLIYEKKYVLNSNSEMPKNISLFVMGEDGKYSASTKVPTGNYIIDEENSYCEGKGTFSNYDSSKGTIKYTVAGQDECIIYFDKTRSLSEKVLVKVSTSDYKSSQDSTIYRVVDQNGVRYEGKDPNNYVEFNGSEQWRIIGVFDGADIGLESGKQYTKIIRSTRIGSYKWIDSGENDWVNSSLYTYLNGTYLKSLSTSNMIVKYSTWYLRGTSTAALYTDGWYDIERTSGTPGYRNGTAGAADPSTRAAIGIMYASDYGYAAYGSSCDNTKTETLSNYNGACAAVDWLAQDSLNNGDAEWLLSPSSTASYGAYRVDGISGGMINGDGATFARAVRPTLYLEPDVYVTSGSGAKNNPYKLDIPKKPTLFETVLAKVRDSEYTSSQEGGGVYKVARETVEYNGTTYDAGVRYEGLDPDNYVTFNGEEAGWRIIGVFEGSTVGLEPGKQYTKIIKSTKLTDYAWDEYQNGAYENDWTNSTLKAYLNGEYLSSLTDSNQIATYNGNYSTWYLRGTSSYTDGTYDSAKWYLTERITGQAGYRNGTQYGADTETKAAIGLMYPSDYGYGAYGSACDNAPYKDLYNYESGCASVDWLLLENDYEWLISPHPDLSDFAFLVFGYVGGDVSDGNVGYALAVRPVLYLEASVGIDTGEGTKDNPYILK